jgi:TolA-binding protein
LNDSLDELKSRIGKLDKQLQDIQSQLQNVQAQSGSAAMRAAAPQQASRTNQPAPRQDGGGAAAPPQQPAANQAPPLAGDLPERVARLQRAHYDVASSEFGDVLHYYPNDDLAGNAQFYLGEIAYRSRSTRTL